MEEQTAPHLGTETVAAANKEERIECRLSVDEKRIISEKAKQAGISRGEFIRRAALGRRIAERVPPELRRLLGATGSNLNQLTKLANSGKLPGVGIEQLNELVTLLLQTLK
jgi:uncharacterized protein (DUF1778 family)